MKIYDAESQIVGRLATRIAKDLLNGERVIVVNVEKAILSGNPKVKVKEYLQRIHRGDPHKGPFFPKTPEGIFKRAVRGMLPWKKAKGREAFKRLRVHIGIPEEFQGKKFLKIKGADSSKLRTKFITLGDLSIQLGAKKRW